MNKVLHWLKENVWIQLVLMVGSIFIFVFYLPIIANKIKTNITRHKDPDYFYFQYKINQNQMKQLIQNIQNQKHNNKIMVMFTPEKNDKSASFKEILQSFIKKQNVNFKVFFTKNDQDAQEKFKVLYRDKFSSFFANITQVNNQKDYNDQVCIMPDINNFNDFIKQPIIILINKNKITKIISDICGQNKQQQVHFLNRFWHNN